MKTICLLFLNVFILLAVSIESQVSTLISSSSEFDMSLWPTLNEIDVKDLAVIEYTMKSSILLAATGENKFDEFHDVDIFVLSVDSLQDQRKNTTISLVRFQIYVTSYNKGEAKIPQSQFSLDSLVVRAFSQPSSKLNFLNGLHESAGSVLLQGISDMKIELVEAVLKKGENQPLSTMDIFLIVVSTSIFTCIICALCQNHIHRSADEQDRAGDLLAGGGKRECSIYDAQIIPTEATTSETKSQKIPFTAITSACSDGNLECGVSPNDENPGDIPNPVSSGKEHANEIEPISSPIAPKSSLSPTRSAHSGYSGRTALSLHVDSILASSHLFASTSTNLSEDRVMESSEISNQSGPLATPLQLMSTTSITKDYCDELSSTSAPPILQGLRLSTVTRQETDDQKPEISFTSIPSSMDVSLDSDGSFTSAPCILLTPQRSDEFQQIHYAREHTENHDIRYSSVERNDLGVENSTSDSLRTPRESPNLSHILLPAGDNQFEKNWTDCKSKAFADKDEDSFGDIFHVDVAAHSSIDETQSRMSGVSAISEWLKSIRVVDSAIDNMTGSTTEHSSIEPKSQTGDLISIDCSLERSMAKSTEGI